MREFVFKVGCHWLGWLLAALLAWLLKGSSP